MSVSSDTETVHIFKLGRGASNGAHGRRTGAASIASDYDDDSISSRYSGEGQSAAGYEAFASGKKGDAAGVG